VENRRQLTELSRAIDVWQRNNDTELVRYRCFQSLNTGKYSVQSEDHYHFPIDPQQVANLDKQFLELLSELSPDERGGAYESVQDAVTAHVESFADFWSDGWDKD
jgi:hypothetical protein